MKKIILILTILLSCYLQAQSPVQEKARWKRVTTAQKLAMDVSNDTYAYEVYDTDLKRKEIYDVNVGSWVPVATINDLTAINTSYNNADSSLTATNVKEGLDELDAEKANINGNASQSFNVANASISTHAINKGQFDALSNVIGVSDSEEKVFTGGETTWVLSQAPSTNFYIKLYAGTNTGGGLVLLDQYVDYTISGNTITYLSPVLPIEAGEKHIIYYNEHDSFVNLYENEVIETNNIKGVTGKATYNFVTHRNKFVEPNLELLNAFTVLGTDFKYFGTILKSLKITKSDDFKILTDAGNIKQIYAPTINHLNASQVYISWNVQKNDGTFQSFTGATYYVTKGADLSNITGTYDLTITGEGTLTFDFIFNFTSIPQGASSVLNTATNAKIADEILLNSFTLANKTQNLDENGKILSSSVKGFKASYLDTGSPDVEFLDKSINIFDHTQETTSGYLDVSGNIVGHAIAKVSYFIKVKPSTDYYYQDYYGFATKICLYDEDKTFISSLPSGTSAPADGTFQTTDNTFFVRVSLRNIDEFMLEEGTTPSTYEPFKRSISKPIESGSKGLKIVCFGDSITFQADSWANEFINTLKPYQFTNMAVSGQKICWRAGTVETTTVPVGANDNNVLWNSIKYWESLMPDAPDVIFIAEGTNDISQGSPLGSYADAFAQDEPSTSQQTMAGAYRKAVQYLKLNYPDTRIFYLTPIQSKTGGRNFDNLKSVRDINKEISERLNVIVIDCLLESGIVDEYEGIGVAGRYLIDGTHPNADGAKRHGEYVINEFNKKFN